MKKLILFFLMFSTFTVSVFAQDKITKGSSVKILEVAKSDSYYADRADFVGKDATALSELTKGNDGFYSGTLETSSGRTVFFTDVKVSVNNSSVKSKTNSGSGFTGSSIPAGTKFKVIEVPSDDAYYSDKSEIEGQTGTTKSALTLDEDGYTSGSIELDNGKSYYFYKVKLGKATGSASTTTSKPTASSSVATLKTPKFITGTIKKGTSVYVAEISPDDSYYSDRFNIVGRKGKVDKNDMTMKEDGYYAGDFMYDDGSTAYFYKAKFSKEPVEKLIKTDNDNDAKKNNTDDDWDLFLDTPSSSSKSSDADGQKIWDAAKNDADINEGDKVEVTAVSPEDSYYEDRDEYVGKKGVAGNDLDYNEDDGGYGGSVKLDNGSSPYFYLVKLKKIGGSNSTSSKTSTSSSTSSDASSIAKGTRVQVVDLDPDDSYYSSKNKYVRKVGKVADGLSSQGNGCYSGKIVFDDGTDAYFFKVKIKVIK
ncbi:MAG TPA: hypothetical protein PLS10_12340 [Chitinophagales bacterium]|nr:hypothetical protein [Chitinophagales bacterium]